MALHYLIALFQILFPILSGPQSAGGGGGGNTYTLNGTPQVLTGCGSVVMCTDAITIGSGKTGFLVTVDSTATITGVTDNGGGMWATHAATCNTASNQFTSCATILSTNTATSITINWSTTTGSPRMVYWEYSVSPGPAAFDGANAAQPIPPAAPNSVTGPSVTGLTGTKDTCVSVAGNNITSNGVNAGSNNVAWGNYQTATSADLENATPSSGTITGAPFTYTAQFGAVGINTVCMK